MNKMELIPTDLAEKVDRYINGQLSEKEIDNLWADLIQNENYMDYLKTVASLKMMSHLFLNNQTLSQSTISFD